MRRTMTFGEVPKWDEFVEAYDAADVPERGFNISGTDIDGTYNSAELHDLLLGLVAHMRRDAEVPKGVARIVADVDEEERESLASSIMTTLGFEWI